jgi:superfamily II DNA or RNA helicase
MFVSPSEPFKLIYSIYEHEFLGFLLESFVVQLDAKGEITYQSQSISSKNLTDFSEGLDADDFDLVKWIDELQQEAIFKKFNTKKNSPHDFFSKVFDPKNTDKLLKDAILSYIEQIKRKVFLHIKTKSLYIMGSDGVPTWKSISVIPEPAKAYFHFERLAEQTVYYPIIKCGDEKVKFQFKQAQIINDLPAALLVGQNLYLFDEYADGKKIKPFLEKPNIIIPKKLEDTYYQKFIVPLIANFNVFAKGFDIVKEEASPKSTLLLTEIAQTAKPLTLFEDNIQNVSDKEATFSVDLSFNYGNHTFRHDNFGGASHVFLEKKEDSWVFHKIKKDRLKEKSILQFLKSQGLDMRVGRKIMPKNELFSWLQAFAQVLKEEGIEIIQNKKNEFQYFVGFSKLQIDIVEKIDWFDVNAVVQFGEFKIPFSKLRHYIVKDIKEFFLPDGQIAIIPAAWFTQFSELFTHLNFSDDTTTTLDKMHHNLARGLSEDGLATTVMSRKLQGLREFESIEAIPLPAYFQGELRPYQKAGYDWLHFLKSFKFGGCLADDMGLGKTVTTLAFLQKMKEEQTQAPSLLVMPTSLIYNWQKEAQKFAPKLKILLHFSPLRNKNPEIFNAFDLVICSYGILRLDIDFIETFRFNYAILDESQAIKNPSSHIFKAVCRLNTANRLILTGTPLENSTVDLWAQMTFINPGLLGSLSHFKTHFQQQIEKQKDEDALKRLFAKIKPFMLRRHKSQVAKDLPEKIETVQYCQMTAEQEKLYEETKAYIRNQLLNDLQQDGLRKSNILVLQGLNKLRQLANHPKMVDDTFEGESGKDNDVMYKLMDVASEGYKTLVFSQYVKHLSLIRRSLNETGIPYLYLDGATKNRQALVDEFQANDTIKVFLISLKAGGVGLNLTKAEYVFILDPWWNPAIEAQAIDRAHRIGQENTVFSYKFISKNTVEEKILDLQNAKKQLFNDLVTTEETFLKSLSEADILSLLA